jgi:transcriptional regulator with XRE-family HTH domain
LPIRKLSIRNRTTGLPGEVAKAQYSPAVPQKKRKKRELSDRAKELVGDAIVTFPGRLSTRLEQLGWTQKELSKQSGISESVISRSPAGMNLRTAIALARAMQVEVGWLVASEGRPPRKVPPASPDFVATKHVPDGKQESQARGAPDIAPRSSRPRHKP